MIAALPQLRIFRVTCGCGYRRERGIHVAEFATGKVSREATWSALEAGHAHEGATWERTERAARTPGNVSPALVQAMPHWFGVRDFVRERLAEEILRQEMLNFHREMGIEPEDGGAA